jgi:hypothetical protein
VKIEIDQSGKIEHLDTSTIVALSNDKTKALIIKASVKRQLFQQLFSGLTSKNDIIPLVFAIAVFFLIDASHVNSIIVIDEEYTGKNTLMANALTKLLNKKFGERWKGSIRFSRIGKHSPAHRLAWELHRKKWKQSALRHLTEQEILKLFTKPMT